MTEYELLLACYRSEQITPADFLRIMADDEEFKNYVNERINK